MAPAAVTSFDDGPLHIDFERREVTVDDKLIDLTSNEYNLLSSLVHLRGKALSHERVQELVLEYAPKSACGVVCDKLGSGLGMITSADVPTDGWCYYGWTPRGADDLYRPSGTLRRSTTRVPTRVAPSVWTFALTSELCHSV